MTGDDLVGTHPAGRRDLLQIGAELAAIADRDPDLARRPLRARVAGRQQRLERGAQTLMGQPRIIATGSRIGGNGLGPIVHRDGGEGRDHIGDTRDRMREQMVGQRMHRLVDLRVDPLAELDHQAPIAQWLDPPVRARG